LKSQKVLLEHILECIERVETYTASGKEGFLSSPIAQDATLRQLQVMAEATTQLSDHLKANHPEIDWRSLAGFRNVLVHDYLGIDLIKVYQVTEENLPSLKAAIERMVEESQK
jgi:uncharacterized protein with HEPN domain